MQNQNEVLAGDPCRLLKRGFHLWEIRARGFLFFPEICGERLYCVQVLGSPVVMKGKILGNIPLPDVQEIVQEEVVPMHVPMYHVVLLDDDAHTYDYVIEMLGDVFGHGIDRAYQMACEVDAQGRVIVDTTHLDRAELKRDQIHGYGADWRMPNSVGGMGAVIEPAV